MADEKPDKPERPETPEAPKATKKAKASPDKELARLRARIAELEAARPAASKPSSATDEIGDSIGRILESVGRVSIAEIKGASERVAKKAASVAEGVAERALARIQDGETKK